MCNLEAKDVKTGLDLSTAYVPEGYSLNGLLDNNFQSSAFPFTTLTACEKQEEGIRFFRETGKAYQQILKHPSLRHRENDMETTYNIPMMTFRSVEEYLDMYVTGMFPGQSLECLQVLNQMPVSSENLDMPNVYQVEIELQSSMFGYGVDQQYVKSLSKLYKAGDSYVLVSGTVAGVKWHVNTPPMILKCRVCELL